MNTNYFVRRNKFRGCLLGLAVGDALGAPVEAWPPHLIRSKLGYVSNYLDSTDGMNAHKLKCGEWTDDTLMALALTRGFIKAAAAEPGLRENIWKADEREKLVQLVSEEHLADWKTNPKNSCYGKATREALQALEQGVSWRKSGSRQSPGNGVAMRIAPAGLWFSESARQSADIGPDDPWLVSEDKEERRKAEQFFFNLMRLTHDLGFITHQGSTALSCGVLQAYLAHKFYRSSRQATMKWKNALWKELTAAANLLVKSLGCATELVAMIRSVQHKGNWRATGDIVASIGSGFTAIQSCTIAWAMAAMFAEDLETGIFAAINSGGDADTVGAMTGALLGAKQGFLAIPERWIFGLDRWTEIAILAGNFFKTTAQET